jgi:hypothetical protein
MRSAMRSAAGELAPVASGSTPSRRGRSTPASSARPGSSRTRSRVRNDRPGSGPARPLRHTGGGRSGGGLPAVRGQLRARARAGRRRWHVLMPGSGRAGRHRRRRRTRRAAVDVLGRGVTTRRSQDGTTSSTPIIPRSSCEAAWQWNTVRPAHR